MSRWAYDRVRDCRRQRPLFSQVLQAGHGIEPKGKKLFERETFGGNGRTCRTCHSKHRGTLTLSDVQRIIDKAKPDDALLIHDALDSDGVGTTRVRRTQPSA